MPQGTLYRTTVRDSWSWMRWDLPGRLLPLTAGPILFLVASHTPPSALGLSGAHVGRDLLLAIPCGLLGFAIAAGFSEYLSRRAHRWFVADRLDLGAQTFYYVVLNAPIEEWFFRGFLQGTLVRWWQAPLLGYLVACLVFGAYHFLGRWGWRAVAGATVAGFGLGVLYLWQPQPPSLLLPVIVHAAITCGFLGPGPYLIYVWRRLHGQARPAIDVPSAV